MILTHAQMMDVAGMVIGDSVIDNNLDATGAINLMHALASGDAALFQVDSDSAGLATVKASGKGDYTESAVMPLVSTFTLVGPGVAPHGVKASDIDDTWQVMLISARWNEHGMEPYAFLPTREEDAVYVVVFAGAKIMAEYADFLKEQEMQENIGKVLEHVANQPTDG